MSRVGAHPRLARALLDGAPKVGARKAAEVVAILADDSFARGDDLAAAWRHLRDTRDARWRAETERLHGGCGARHGPPDDLVAGLVVGLAYPERLARLRSGGYLMAGGTEAALPPGSSLTGHPWLAIAVADRQPGNAAARIRLAAAIDEDTAREAGAALLSTVDEVTAEGAERRDQLGAITLRRRELKNPPRELVERALREALAKQGLRWTKEAAQLRLRMDFCHRVLGAPWPDVSDASVDRAHRPEHRHATVHSGPGADAAGHAAVARRAAPGRAGAGAAAGAERLHRSGWTTATRRRPSSR